MFFSWEVHGESPITSKQEETSKNCVNCRPEAENRSRKATTKQGKKIRQHKKNLTHKPNNGILKFAMHK